MGLYGAVILQRLCDFAMRNKRLLPYRERVIGAAEVCVDRGNRIPDRPHCDRLYAGAKADEVHVRGQCQAAVMASG